MAVGHRNGFRGSAAFFALLLAATSGAAAETPAAEVSSLDHGAAGAPDHAPLALHASLHTIGAGLPASSKFSRRRLPFSRVPQARSLPA
jgi:hypothetical protein